MTARILVVDDEQDLEALMRQKFRRQIADGSFSLSFASDGVEALALLDGDPGIADLVISDINMPRMDGLALLARLQDGGFDMTTIIVSAYGDMANIRTAMNRGAFDFVTKPIDFTDLELTIAKTLRHVDQRREAQRKQAAAERAHAALSRYFSPNLAERLASEDDIASLAGRKREIAALFTDIAGFTTLAETIDPQLLGELLNDYLVGMTDVVFAHEGTVPKVVGDALHVLFGAPGDQDDYAARAIACAIDLDAFSETFRRAWRSRGIDLDVTRIGVHAGPAIVGNFGGTRFFDYTAYGDTINIAARLEAANKQLGTRICVSDSAARQVPGFRGRPVGDLVLKGRSQPLRAFEPVPPDSDPALESYIKAFTLLEAEHPGAIGAFAADVGMRPEDRLAAFHLKRLLNGTTGTRIPMD